MSLKDYYQTLTLHKRVTRNQTLPKPNPSKSSEEVSLLEPKPNKQKKVLIKKDSSTQKEMSDYFPEEQALSQKKKKMKRLVKGSDPYKLKKDLPEFEKKASASKIGMAFSKHPLN